MPDEKNLSNKTDSWHMALSFGVNSCWPRKPVLYTLMLSIHTITTLYGLKETPASMRLTKSRLSGPALSKYSPAKANETSMSDGALYVLIFWKKTALKNVKFGFNAI